MIPELGHFALILALAASLLQVVLPLTGYWRRDSRLLATAPAIAQTQFLFVLISYACLTYAFVTKDFSVAYVAENDHSLLPLVYRFSAVWGAHEGSLLLWALILAGWTLAVSIASRGLPVSLTGLVLAVLGTVAAGFQLFILLTSSPFTRLFPAPAEGRDLNPVLQDPGLAIHPPLLYMGYVGFAVAFAFAIAALISGRMDAAWARWTRPWTTAAWSFLTLGITVGSWWAYKELGWGGWWFWDPVENASFMPWLAGTALIHSLSVTEKRGLLKSWTVLLAILAFSLSLLGTFLVRSGVIVSVHAFASDPTRGIFILGFLGLVVGAALMLYAWRAPRLAATVDIRLFSREGLILFNNVFLLAAAGAVLFGTLYPLVLEVLGAGKISAGPPYYRVVFVPLVIPLLILVGTVAAVPWKRGKAGEALRRLRTPAIAALACGAVLPFALLGRNSLEAAAGAMFAVWIVIGAITEIVQRVRSRSRWQNGLAQVPRGAWGMTLAHIGLGVWVIGVACVGSFSTEKDARLKPGDALELSGYSFTLVGAGEHPGPNYTAERAEIRVAHDGRPVSTLYPEKRLYTAQQRVQTKSARDVTPLRDLYVALGESYPDGSWSLRVYVKPMMRWVWLAGLLMAFGGGLALSDPRYRLARAAAAAAREAAQPA
jgi:cytochrome c-type biogenesis protein CcmF